MTRKKTLSKHKKSIAQKTTYYHDFVITVVITLIGIVSLFYLVRSFPNLSLDKNSSDPNLTTNFNASPSATLTPAKPTPTNKSQSTPIFKPNEFSLRIPILMYHYIGNNPNPADLQRDVLSITPDKFNEQMKYLNDNGYKTISLDTMYSYLINKTQVNPKTIILTFDDGYIDFFYNAFPILSQYNLSATVFIITGKVGTPAYLTWDQIKQIQNSNLITFQAHTVNHAYLTSLSIDSMDFELRESKKVLQEKLGIPVNFMAYPIGATDSLVIERARQAGYVGAVGTWLGDNQSMSVIYNIPRKRIRGNIDLATFISYL